MHHYKSSRGQRIFILFIIFLLPIFLFREYKLLSEKKNGAIITEDTYYESHPHKAIHHHFAVIVPVLTDDISLLRNAESIKDQTYTDYHVEYILRNPSKEVVSELKQYISESGKSDVVTIHSATTEEQFFQKYIEAVQRCDNETIVVHLKGSDWFSNEDTLQSYDLIYQNQDIWLTYSQYMDFPKMQKGKSKPHARNRYVGKRVHRAPWVTSYSKTFYARIFKEYFSSSNVSDYCHSLSKLDELLVPIADIGKMHVRFIPEVLYVHADLFAIKRKVMTLGNFGERCAESILKRKHIDTSTNEKGCDAFFFSCGTPEVLNSFLHEAKEKISDISDTFVFYTEKTEGEYEKVVASHPKVIFFNLSGLDGEEVKATLSSAVHASGSVNRFLFMSHDRASIKKPIQLASDCTRLKNASASALYYHLGNESEIDGPFQTSLRFAAARFCGDGYYSWNLRKGKQSFKSPDTFLCTLYSCRFVNRLLKEKQFVGLDDLFMKDTSSVYGVGMFNVDASVTAAK